MFGCRFCWTWFDTKRELNYTNRIQLRAYLSFLTTLSPWTLDLSLLSVFSKLHWEPTAFLLLFLLTLMQSCWRFKNRTYAIAGLEQMWNCCLAISPKIITNNELIIFFICLVIISRFSACQDWSILRISLMTGIRGYVSTSRHSCGVFAWLLQWTS